MIFYVLEHFLNTHFLIFTTLAELVEKYVVCGDVPVTLTQLSEDGFTVDDMILLIKKLAGISG